MNDKEKEGCSDLALYGTDLEYIPIGLTKREYFAALAMQGWIACQSIDYEGNPKETAKLAVKCADSLLEELDKEK